MGGDVIRATVELPVAAVAVSAAPPELISQRISEAVLGIPRRAYLESLPSFRASGGAVIALGRLRLVKRTEYVTWLGKRDNAHEADDVDTLAAELGLQPVGGRR